MLSVVIFCISLLIKETIQMLIKRKGTGTYGWFLHSYLMNPLTVKKNNGSKNTALSSWLKTLLQPSQIYSNTSIFGFNRMLAEKKHFFFLEGPFTVICNKWLSVFLCMLIMNFHWFSVKINRSNISQNVGQLTLVWINLQGVSSASVYLFFTNSMPKKIHNKKNTEYFFFFVVSVHAAWIILPLLFFLKEKVSCQYLASNY